MNFVRGLLVKDLNSIVTILKRCSAVCALLIYYLPNNFDLISIRQKNLFCNSNNFVQKSGHLITKNTLFKLCNV
jgi:hypothetical protein